MNRGLEKFALGEEGMKRRSRGAAGAKTGNNKEVKQQINKEEK